MYEVVLENPPLESIGKHIQERLLSMGLRLTTTARSFSMANAQRMSKVPIQSVRRVCECVYVYFIQLSATAQLQNGKYPLL